MKPENIIHKFNHQSGRIIQVGSAGIYVEELGSTDAFPIVLLHGGFGSLEDFNSLLPELKGNYRYIGIDSRGHGRSTLGDEPLTYALLEKDVETVLKHLNITKCYLVGFSDGGISAFRLGIKGLAQVAKIVVIGADWNPPNPDLQARFSAITTESWKARFPEGVELYHRLNPGADFDILVKRVIAMWLDPEGYPKDRIKEIQCEVMIVRGDDDHLVPRSGITTLSEYLPSAKFLNIPFAGHATHVDQSAIVAKILMRFFKTDFLAKFNDDKNSVKLKG